jgi:hypothetical protein
VKRIILAALAAAFLTTATLGAAATAAAEPKCHENPHGKLVGCPKK